MTAAAKLDTSPVSIREAMSDPQLFGKQFGGESWQAWRALLAGFYGLPLDSAELALWHELTGRLRAPESGHDELWLAVGRRGGKSQCAALLAVYAGAFRDYRSRLAPGEVATVMVLACDKRQARTVFRYIVGLIESNPMLARMVVRADSQAVELTNRSVIEVHSSNFRSVRGYSIACAIADEIAFWHSDYSANPDAEIIGALRPSLSTLDGKLIALSSPYAKRGELWSTYKRYYGQAGPVLVAQAPSLTMNPTLPQRVVDQAMVRDAEAARAEYLAEFRSDLASFADREVVDSCVIPSRRELPYCSQFKYEAFVDPSGGSNDAMTLAIGHAEDGIVVVDAVRESRPPFSPEVVVKEYAELLRDYRVSTVEGDRYAGEWPRERFEVHRVTYKTADRTRSDLYRDLLPQLNAGRIELLDNDRLVSQIAGLERRTARGGRDSIDHPPGQHDDLANAVAGLASMLSSRRKSTYTLANL